MGTDPITDISMAAIRCVMVVIVNRNVLKSLAFAAYVLLCTMIFVIQPLGARASDVSGAKASPEEFMSQLKMRLNLSEDQEAKINPIIEESIQKRREIVKNSSQDRKTVRNQLQELRWSTDMQIGKILTEAQMKEYQELREEQHEKVENNDIQHGRKSRYGGLQGS